MSNPRVDEFIAAFSEKTPKQMRTIRNNLNNRMSSFEDEVKVGKTLPKLSTSHMLYDFDMKDCRKLLEAAKRQVKANK